MNGLRAAVADASVRPHAAPYAYPPASPPVPPHVEASARNVRSALLVGAWHRLGRITNRKCTAEVLENRKADCRILNRFGTRAARRRVGS